MYKPRIRHVTEIRRKRQGESGRSIKRMVKEKPKVKPLNDFTILVFIINQTSEHLVNIFPTIHQLPQPLELNFTYHL